jgi:hypothetical protein
VRILFKQVLETAKVEAMKTLTREGKIGEFTKVF